MTVVGNPNLPAFGESKHFSSDQLGFSFGHIPVQTLPNVSGFIGGDTLTPVVAIQIEDQPTGTLLIDLGTNGELMLKVGTGLSA